MAFYTNGEKFECWPQKRRRVLDIPGNELLVDNFILKV